MPVFPLFLSDSERGIDCVVVETFVLSHLSIRVDDSYSQDNNNNNNNNHHNDSQHGLHPPVQTRGC